MELFMRPDGTVQAIYDEAISLAELGDVQIERASHVEPAPLDRGKWMADLAPVGGPLLGPFDTRSEALAAEVAWISAQLERGPVAVKAAGNE